MATTETLNGDLKNLSLNGKSEVPKKDENSNLLELFSNLKEEECIRGTTPADIEKRCLDLCRTYIGGSWNNATGPQDIEINRITGGLTNQLYRVRLRESVPRVARNPLYPGTPEPLDVAIKLYQPKHMKSYHEDDGERLNDIITLTILSELDIGPKVFGIFADGMIQAFHENEQFTLKYQNQPDKLAEVAHLLARVHHLNVPVRKNNDWVTNQTMICLNRAYNENNAGQMIQEHKLERLIARDPRDECKELLTYVEELGAPFVFCHNDFRGSNILVTKPDQKILFVDLEYSAYGYRGHDLANYLNEWGHESFDFDKHGVPSDEVIAMFARLYLDGCDKLEPGYSSRPENSVEQLVKEVKVQAMSMYLFFMAFLMQTTDHFVDAIPFDPVSNIKYCEAAYTQYFELKERLIKDGTIKPKK